MSMTATRKSAIMETTAVETATAQRDIPEQEESPEGANNAPTNTESIVHGTPEHIVTARQQFDNFKTKQLDLNLHRDLRHGWMLPALLMLDECLWQRWSYWCECCSRQELPPAPIPQIEFLTVPHTATHRMLEASLNAIPRHGSWQTWGSWNYVEYFFDWLLFGFGHKGQAELPPEPAGCEGAGNRLYQLFCLDAMLLWPHDYFGQMLADSAYGKSQAFYPTPHTVCEMMTRMLCDDGSDLRTQTVCDPCVGTGRFLLHASNHSLRLYGMDIDPVLCRATLVNAYLYAPWIVRPIPWLDPALAEVAHIPDSREPTSSAATTVAAQLSDCMAEAAPPHVQDYLSDTEHDSEQQPQLAPLLKRHKKLRVDATQGALF